MLFNIHNACGATVETSRPAQLTALTGASKMSNSGKRKFRRTMMYRPAAVEFGGIGIVDPKCLVGEFFVGQGRHDRPAAQLEIERSRDGVHGVPQRFCLQPAAIHLPEKAIVGIDAGMFLGEEIAAPADRCAKAESVGANRLMLPPVRDEFRGQPVEQLGMCRRLPHFAEVVGC